MIVGINLIVLSIFTFIDTKICHIKKKSIWLDSIQRFSSKRFPNWSTDRVTVAIEIIYVLVSGLCLVFVGVGSFRGKNILQVDT